MELYYLKLKALSSLFLPRLFPNLNSLTWKGDLDYGEDFNVDDISFARWVHMESLNITTQIYSTAIIIESSVYHRLAKLDVCFYKASGGRDATFVVKPFLEKFANLPALKKLELAYINIDLEDMETLHGATSELEEISFEMLT